MAPHKPQEVVILYICLFLLWLKTCWKANRSQSEIILVILDILNLFTRLIRIRYLNNPISCKGEKWLTSHKFLLLNRWLLIYWYNICCSVQTTACVSTTYHSAILMKITQPPPAAAAPQLWLQPPPSKKQPQAQPVQ